MAMPMVAQDAHPNVLEEILGPELLDLQHEATALLDQSLELADLIWELEGEYFSSQEPRGRSTSLKSITDYEHDGLEEFTELPEYDLEENDDDDGSEEVYYQLVDLHAEAAELSKRSGDAWTLFCEEVVARLSPSSPSYDSAQWRPQARKQKLRQRRHQRSGRTLALRDEYIEGEEEAGSMVPPMMHPEADAPHYYYADDEDAFMPSTHTEEIPIYFEEDDTDLAEFNWNHPASHDDGDCHVNRDCYGEEEAEEEMDDYEFMEMIRQEYLDLAEQHLSSQVHLPEKKNTKETDDAGTDSDSEKPYIADVEELPGLLENLMEGEGDGDFDDSGYDEEDMVVDSPSHKHNDSGFVGDDDTDSDNESFKSCLDEFDGGDGDGDLEGDYQEHEAEQLHIDQIEE
ncbi:hypothetical protein PG993_011813 [Apiospora rasikravindrae]|uniref:Transcription factor Iwr1 domain-containing protein n=1 Tax=Apiospora rasikravindrae TaxID=990691 RepID=A0ABR1S0P4_9PEZI